MTLADERRAEQRLNESVLEHVRQDFVQIRLDQSIGEALAELQRKQVGSRIVYFYVVDEEGRLQGVVPTRRMLLNPPDTPIRGVMVPRVISLPHTATLLDACEMFLFHRLLALPVLDAQGRIVGIVDVERYTDEMTDLAQHTESDDIFQLIGVHVAQVRQASAPVVFMNRFPWLLCNIGGGLLCALIAGLFERVLAEVVALALFIPVVLALAESVSIQSLTLTLQSQHGRKISWSTAIGSLFREAPVGAMLGLACGALVAAAAWLWQGAPVVALCILSAIALSIATATLIGLLVPTILRSVQRDPKVASGPITLAMTDLATMFYYLGLASWLL